MKIKMQRLKSITQKLGHTKSYDFTCQTISGKVDDAYSKNQEESGNCCIGYRHLTALWCFFYFAMVNCHVSVVSVSIVAMVNHTQVTKMQPTTNTSSVSCPVPVVTEDSTTKVKLDGPFVWDSQTQGQVLGLSGFGYMFSNFFAGRVAEIVGAKRTLLVADFFVNVCTIVSPFAATWSVYALIVFQIARGFSQGFIVPCIFVMMASWFPRSERGLLSSFASIGCPVGALVTGATIGRLCDIPSLGWASAFYIMGAFNLCISAIYACVFFELPKNNPYISKEELKFIVGNQENDMSIKRPPVPWKQIATSIPVYALTLGKFGLYWSLAHFLYMHPTFMGTVLHFSMTENGFFSSLYFLLMTIGTIISMIASHWLLKKDCMGVNNLRKSCSSISALGFSLCLIGVLLADCDKLKNLVFCSLASLFGGFGMSGTLIASGDMSPKFSGSLAGFTSSAACLATLFLPVTVGALTKRETLEEWHTVFYIHIAITLSCGVIFQVFGSADIQPWNSTESKETNTPVEQPQAMQPVSTSTPTRIHI